MKNLHPRQKRPTRSRGNVAFTLIEVLLATGIFSLVIIAIYSSWSSIMRGTRVGLTAAAEVQRTRVAIRSLEESLGAAVMYSDNARYYGFYAETAGDFAYLSFVARLPESFPGSGLFPGQPLRRVTFRVDEEKNLMLSQSTLLDISAQPYTIKLAPKAVVFALEFFNPRMNEWIPEWIATNALPTMVRVAMDFGEKRGQENITIRSIPLTATAITRVGGTPQTQGPGGTLDGGRRGGTGGAADARGGRGNESGRGGGGNRMGGGGGNFGGGNMGGGNRGGGPGGGMMGDGPAYRWNGPVNLPPNFDQRGSALTRNRAFEGR